MVAIRKVLSATILFGALAALGGCAGRQDSVPVTGTAISGVVCPPAGTIAVREDGSRVRYSGADPSDPAFCLVTTPTGGTSRSLGGLTSTQPSNEAVRRNAMASLFPLAEGLTSTARFGLVSPLNPLYENPFEESFQVVGERAYRLEDGEQRQTWLVESTLRSMLDPSVAFITASQVDKETGVILSQSTISASGSVPAGRPFRVAELRRPQTTAR